MRGQSAKRLAYPLLPHGTPRAIKARDLEFDRCYKPHAVELCREWHSRLPNVQNGPWMHAFRGHVDGVTYVVALWNNPCTRSLPSHWLELRRLARSPDAPRNTCSRFLGWMARYFREHHPDRERLISYQDTAVHLGTIYKAAGWSEVYAGQERTRDRSKPRVGTTRPYRENINGTAKDASRKVRWELEL